MSRSCKWCGCFIIEPQELEEHEQIHRDLDFLNGMDNVQTEDGNHWEVQQHVETVQECLETHDVTERSVSSMFPCEICHKYFSSESNLRRHENAQHKSTACIKCLKCHKIFKYDHDMKYHQQTCVGMTEHVCSQCNKRCSTAHGLRRHIEWHDKAPKIATKRNSRSLSPSKNTRGSVSSAPAAKRPRNAIISSQQYRCRRCTDCFSNRRDLYLHGMRHHLQRPPWERDDSAPWSRDGRNDRLREIYEVNAPLILEPHRPGSIQSIYNFPLDNDVTVDQLMGYADDIYRQEQRSFRLNMVFGTILENRETGELRYFVPYNNNGIFERPLYISRRTDLQRLRLRLQRMDIMTELLRQRPDTKWLPVLVTNVHFTVFTTYYPIGQGDLPDYILKKNSIYPLVNNRQTGKVYQDQLCAFRCLALHRGHDIKAVDGSANEFRRQWMEHARSESDEVTFEDFPAFEQFFKLNMEVFNLDEDGFANSVYKSRHQQESTMYVNMYQNHLSYIRDFGLYAQKYRCNTCDRHFKHSRDLHRHQRVCSNQTKYVYPGGFYQSKVSVFDELDRYGINVPDDQRTFPWFICYDFEAILEKVNDRPTEFLQWTQKHIPISVSICSNVEGHTAPSCIVEPDQDKLVRNMVETMKQIADSVYNLAEQKWGWVLEAIDTKLKQDSNFEEDPDISVTDEETEEGEDGEEGDKTPTHPLQKIYGYLEGYMSQLPVIGFNSAKYDLNLVKRSIAKALNMHLTASKPPFAIKKNNEYACIATDQLKFLDMKQYLSGGSSYVGFLKAYHVKEQKGFFPYEWFDDVSKLEEKSLPPHEAFHSNLKGSNISEEEYGFCHKVWRERNMTTFKDFLVWYNDLDVAPFVDAVQRFQTFYFDKGIDVFKTAISVPGIARQLLFRAAKQQNANFALFDKYNTDLYQTIKRNIIGGPSIIFTRHHKVGQTCIRGKKPCGSVLGFDANALYLEAIGKPMPVGPFLRRRAVNDFRPEIRDKYMTAYYWMDWLMRIRDIKIQHKLNFGREVVIGKYPVDGYCPASQPGENPTVFQFHGCFWHGHLCDVTKGVKDEKWKASRHEKYQKTLETTAYLKARGHDVIEMWEYEFRRYCRQNTGIYAFIDSMRPGFFQKHKEKITENSILEGVVKGDLFSMVEVDIEVPQEWPSYFQHPSMAPHEYFHEMWPLFCTTDIPFEAIGPHMQDHVEKRNLSKAPRRLLVGGMKGKQLMLATPLLQWYLNHGMVVTKIYQLVEFQRQRCFKGFVKEISEARRSGDRDPDTSIIADTNKVIGNSGYGSLIMDQTKHRNVKYVQGENETCLKINDPRFRKLECLDFEEQYYEIEMAKRIIKLDLPIQLGYFILQYAKLRMLEFYYDFMDEYVDRLDFEYCEMDTDSAYLAISGSCLDDVIKPGMRGLRGFCTGTDIEADTGYHWFPRTCCQDHAKYDKRTPGLFKLEYQGDEMIGLCSKTYIVRKTKTIKPSLSRIAAYKLVRCSLNMKSKPCPYKPRRMNEYKFSSKGVSKRSLKAPMVKFQTVLSTGKSQSGTNRGFRVRNNRIFTYTQERRGFSYFYCKRKVMEDGIHTSPLDITLCPVPEKDQEVDDQELVDILVEFSESNE